MLCRTRRVLLSLLTGALLVLATAASASAAITTYAGDGNWPNGGDGGPATAASLFYPQSTVVAPDGTLYIADTGNNSIRKVSPGGTITLFAGRTRTIGFGGDGGPAVDAQLGEPRGLALSSTGALYFADPDNQRIRKIDTDGVITTVAGDGEAGFSGDDGPATSARLGYAMGVAVGADGTLYVADTGNSRVRKVTPGGTITTVLDSTNVSSPADIAVSGDGTLYVADSLNGHILKVTRPGVVTTLATVLNPSGIDVDAAGNVDVARGWNNNVVRVSLLGIVTPVAGAANGAQGFSGDGGLATSARLDSPDDVAVGPDGSLYITDAYNGRVRRVDIAGVIGTVAGDGNTGHRGDGGPAAGATLNQPYSSALAPDGSLYIADTGNQRIRKVSPSGVMTTVAGNGAQGEYSMGDFSGDGGPAVDAALSYPAGVAVADDGTLYIADTGNQRIRKVDADGVITTVAGSGTEPSQGYQGNLVGGFAGDGGQATQARLGDPNGIAVGPDGTLYIADSSNDRVRTVDAQGVITTVAGSGSGEYTGDGGQATGAGMYYPTATELAPDGTLYIVDAGDSVVRAVDADGVITTVAGNGEFAYSGDGGPAVDAALQYPGGMTLGAHGELYIADTGNNVVRRVTAAGVISTVSGTGDPGFGGDGGAGINARLDAPYDVDVSSDGTLFITDTWNSRIRVQTQRAPAAETRAATDITQTDATLNAAIIPGDDRADYTFQWGEDSRYGQTLKGGDLDSGDTSRDVSATLDSLTPGTTYHYRVAVTSALGTAYGEDGTFTTSPAPQPPVVTSGPAQNVGSRSATLTGSVNAQGLGTVYRFQFGESTHEAYDDQTGTSTVGSGRKDLAVTRAIDELKPATTYRYRVVAINLAGTSYGDDVTFTTDTIVPAVTTGAVTGIDRHAATFHGTVGTLAEPTQSWFQYGATDRYGTTTNPVEAVDGPVTSDLSELAAGTTYHVRAVAMNDLGETAYGDDVVFTTADGAPPIVTTGAATAISRTTATLNASIESQFDNAYYAFEYGLTDGYGEAAGKGKLEAGSGASPATLDLTGLTPGTTYHFHVYAENNDGMSFGDDATFTTALAAPQAQSDEQQDVTETAATVTGAIDTGGLSTDWHVDYGPTLAYGQVTDTVTQTAGGPVTVRLRGLTAGSSYHYRFVVENTDGIRYSADQQLTTVALPAPPAATPDVPAAPAVTPTPTPVTPFDPAPPLLPTVTFKHLPNSPAVRVTTTTALVRARCDQPARATCTATVNLYERVSRAGKVTLNLLGHGVRTMKAGRSRTAVVTVTLTARGRALIRKTAGKGSPALVVTVRLRSSNPQGRATTKFATRPVRLARKP